MARVHVPITVLDADGVPVSGASVTIRKRADNSLVSVYSTETGGTAGANPASTDTTGRVDRWIERQAVKMTVTATGMTTYDEYWDAVPAGDGTIDDAYLGPVALRLNTPANRKVAWGIGTITFPGGIDKWSVDVSHGMGIVPVLAVTTPRSGGTAPSPHFTLAQFALTATIVTVEAKTTDASNPPNGATLLFDWLAIA